MATGKVETGKTLVAETKEKKDKMVL